MLTKLIATGIFFTMSFLGYTPKDYSYLLPPPIKSIVDQNISIPVNKETSTTTKQILINTFPIAPEEIKIKKIVATTTVLKIKKNSTKTESLNQTDETIKTLEGQADKIIIVATSTPSLPVPQNNSAQTSGSLLSSNSSVKEKISSSVVNIYCQAIRGPNIETVVGSAVQVDPSGVYLTNAHVAIYVMLSDTQPIGSVSCYIREGSPVKKIYEAKSVYIPTAWVNSHSNAYKLGIELVGTGEKDYALIKRGNSNPNLNRNDFPTEWSSPLVSNLPTLGQNIILAGYPVFDKSIISSALYLLINNSSVLNIFNLNGEPNSLFDSTSTKLAQIGSSGGGAFDDQGNLFGIMGAAINNTPGELPSERIIGINYIKKDILKDSGKTFESLLQNADYESLNFIKNSAPALSKILTSNQ
ncbi:MAG: serine protease [bacterium]